MNYQSSISEKDRDRINRFCLMDDEFMQKCLEDSIECTELIISIILKRDDLGIKSVRTQHKIKNLHGRSVVLDIYAEDDEGKHYNIEIQRSDHGADPRRARYYSSLMDANVSSPGEAFEDLPEIYVIFITENDVLKGGLPIYHIERKVIETEEPFNDGSHIIYVNGRYQDESPLGLLMEDFFCRDPDKMNYKVLADRVRYFKKDEKGGAAMSRIMDEVREEGIEIGKREAMFKLIKAGKISYEDAKDLWGFTPEEINEVSQHRKRSSNEPYNG